MITCCKYAALLHLAASGLFPVGVHAASSSIRAGGGASFTTGINATAESLHRGRIHQYDCSQHLDHNQCLLAEGCDWMQGLCIGPVTTPPPVSNEASATEGAGYCSDDSSACFSMSECSCAAAAAAAEAAPLAPEEGLFSGRRLQTNCPSATKSGKCRKRGCTWNGQACVAPPAPTDKPTPPPSTSPSDQPTEAPTPCACLGVTTLPPTKAQSNQPSTSPTNSPSSFPSEQPTQAPSSAPTNQLTGSPSTLLVTQTKSPATTSHPSTSPSMQPTTSPINPTNVPSLSPSKTPTLNPVTNEPTTVPSDAPTLSPTQLSLQDVGDEGVPIGAFPLEECQGDCDNDGDCQTPLLCYQRSSTEPVPGCSGLGTSGKDYCAARPANFLFLRINNGSLGPCDGNCDSDVDCQENLVCEERTGDQVVPGCEGEGVSGLNYCRYPSLDPSLVKLGNDGYPIDVFPLGPCEGDCDHDGECEGSLQCFQRTAFEPVPGCLTNGESSTDYCASRPTDNTLFLKGDNGKPSANFPLGLCEGDCDSDAQCDGSLICRYRNGDEDVPGCQGEGTSGEDYCRLPSLPSLVKLGNDGYPIDVFPLAECEGDCDHDGECEGSLQCFQRTAFEPVPGCLTNGESSTDYCASRPTDNTLFLKGDNGKPSANFPLGLCEGDCDSDAQCEGSLSCFSREGTEIIPGCEGLGVSGKDYCYNNGPTSPPAPKPTYAPNTFGATYVPGDLSVPCDDGKLMLSKGMSCELLTTAGQPVQYANGTFSQQTMHQRADGAGVVPHPTDDGWYYVSNSETKASLGGGVGTLRFNANGGVIGYERTLFDTSDNCGGGRTYWDTWITCEEDGGSGYCHEVDPHTGYTSQIKNVPDGGNYESFAYDRADPDVEARFFTTEDMGDGALIRYTPHASAFRTNNNYDILNTDNGSYEYLVLNNVDMTFSWSSNIVDGEASARDLFPNSEGIDVHNRILNFVSKVNKELFTLDLVGGTWTVSSTASGAFDLQPDQLGRIIGDSDVLYFCEDGGSNSDIHGRDATGQYFTIVRGDGYSTETTGLAFSPNNKFMYMAFQGNSNVYAFWRDDGLPFNGVAAYTKYHAT